MADFEEDLAKKPFADIAGVEEHASEGDDYSSEEDDFELPAPQTLRGIRDQLHNIRFTDYLKGFDEMAAKQSTVFTSLPSATVDERQRAQLLGIGVEQEDEEMQHRNDLEHIDVLKKRRMFELKRRATEQRAVQSRNIRQIALKASLTEELLGTYFQYTQQQLTLHLASRRAEVLQSLGEVRRFDRGDFDPEKPDWNRFEQQVEINIQSLRGVKDKLPRGEYMILISKWDKMAGDPMPWSYRSYSDRHPPPCPLHWETKDLSVRSRCEVCQGWCGGTMSIQHDGRATSYEMDFNSKIFTFFPSQKTIKPYMALMIELVKLPKNRKGDPKIVGWGVMPCVDSGFNIINGKFRFPILRGEYSPDYMHHKDIATAISEDIENWLCNCYVDIFPHHREHLGRDEFRLQNEFSARILGIDDTHIPQYPVKVEDTSGWVVLEGRPRGHSFLLQQEEALRKEEEALARKMQKERRAALEDVILEEGGEGGMGSSVRSPKRRVLPDDDFGDDDDGGQYRPDEYGDFEPYIEENYPYNRPDTWESEETIGRALWAMLRQAVHNKARERRAEEAESNRRMLRQAQEKRRYRFSIHPLGAVMLHSTWRVQFDYSTRAIFDEMSLTQGFKNYKMYLNIFAIIVSLAVQVYLNGCFKFIACAILSIPVFSVTPKGYGLVITYDLPNSIALEEFFVCVIAQFGNFLVCAALILFGLSLRYGTGGVPNNLSKFVYSTAIGAFCTPYIMLFIDLGQNIRNGDILRLHHYFEDHGYGAMFGYLVFFLTFFWFMALLYVVIFLYTMHIHLNGIIQDAYWRIMLVDEDNFFIPEDLECSKRELFYILEKAEQWRGKNGERRKVTVNHLTTTDDEDKSFVAEAQYISISTLHCGNSEAYLRAVRDEPDDPEFVSSYRQFYVMPDGAILETLKQALPNGMAFLLAKLDSRFMTGRGNFNPAHTLVEAMRRAGYVVGANGLRRQTMAVDADALGRSVWGEASFGGFGGFE